MDHATPAPSSPSLFERLLRLVIVAILTMLGFYVKILAGILKLGIRAVKSVPAGSTRDRP